MKKIYLITFLVTLIDQIIKLFVTFNMNLYQSIEIIKDFFSITYVKNTGAAFSILSGNRILLIIFAVIALNLIYIFLLKDKKLNKLENIIYGVLIGGIIGNLIDRVLFGSVIDYLDFNLFGYNYPVFNFADICMVVSAIILIIITIKDGKNEIHSKWIKH